MMSQNQKEELFPTIGQLADKTNQLKDDEDADHQTEDNGENAVQQIESLCMKCHEQGVTRLLLTSIPFFREVIVMSFRCEHCGTQNNEIQSAGTIRTEGTVYTTRILARSDLNRQIVRSSSCEIQIPELELTLPPTERGQLTTVEGLIRDVVADLAQDQPLRRIQDEEGYNTIEKLLGKLRDILGDEDGEQDAQLGKAAEKDIPMPAFTVKLDDPAGNSFIEFIGGASDPKWNMRSYPRTLQQNIALGLVADPAHTENGEAEYSATESAPITDDEIFVFPGTCSSCGHPINTYMKKVIIPYFKDILIMSTNCDRCGYRDNEVKSGSAISEQGKRITLKVEDKEDLSRDILKSETAGLSIPEIDLVLTHGTLGGRFTTLEGILDQVYEELSEKAFAGDSSTAEGRKTFEDFLSGLKEVKTASRPFTLILDDPLANSYLQNIYAPDPDPNMTIVLYERTWEQNEELGLNDIKVEGYEEDAEREKGEPADKTEKAGTTETGA
ncbi:zf-ZPR1-domain-containing protein [Cyathus striatus]|nr:zf-ZPR1-domain-containing protein [Cyathus striatus]